MSATIRLRHVRTSDHAGGKAQTLARLLQQGWPVPDGFCVEAAVLDQALAAAGLAGADESLAYRWRDDPRGIEAERLALATLAIPATIADEIVAAYRDLSDAAGAANAAGGSCPSGVRGRPPVSRVSPRVSTRQWAPVAVRSSALAEDGERASFAGIMESFLNVCGPAALLDAIRGCWASRLADAALSYRSSAQENSGFRMGVLVQLMLPATASGVMFTADPVAGDRARLVINATAGLSADLLTGQTDGDTFILGKASGEVLSERIADKPQVLTASTGGGVRRIAAAEQSRAAAALSHAQLFRLRDCAVGLEAVLGDNLDVEWVFCGDELFVVQARPITPTGSRAPGDAAFAGLPRPDLYWLCADELFPEPVCEWSLLLFEKFAEGLNLARATWRSPCELHVGRAAGWMFMADELHVRELPQGHQRDYEQAIRRTVAEAPARWHAQWKAEAVARNLAMLHTDLGGLSDDELLDRMDSWLTGMARDETTGGIIGMVPAFALAHLARTGGVIATELARHALSGLPSMLEEIEDALWVLARRLEGHPRARAAVLAEPASEALAACRSEPAAWDPIAAFLLSYGFHGMESIESAPWHEDPAPLISVLRGKVGKVEERPAGRLAASAARRATAVAALVAEHPDLAEVIRAHVAELEACLPLGQDRYIVFTELGHAVARHMVLEIGRRLVARGLLSAPDDAMHLRPAEIDRVVRHGTDSRALVARRRQGLAKAAAVRPPRSLGTVLTLADAPYLIDSILSDRSSGLDAPARQEPSDGGREVIGEGIASSPGRHSGRAVVCASLADASRLRRDDVLVCDTTSPAWTQYFGIVGAVVTERGGMLSHPAVVAREYGIPAVTGLTGACSVIDTGRWICVDGDRGLVLADSGETEPT